MSQYLIPRENIKNDIFSVEDAEFHHIVDVKRRKIGDIINIFDGKGNRFSAKITEITKSFLLGVILDRLPSVMPKLKLTLCFSLVDKQPLKDIFNYCTQIGVETFCPIIAERTQKQFLSGWDKKEKKIKEIFVSACKQSERAVLPELCKPVTLKEAMLKFTPAFIAHKDDKSAKIEDVVKSDCLAIFIGPEGGFTADEILKAERAGITKISLGDNILKTETACVAAVSKILL